MLKNKIGSIEREEKRLLRRFRSQVKLLKTKQEQRLGNLTLKRSNSNGVQFKKASPSPQSEVNSLLIFYKVVLFDKHACLEALDSRYLYSVGEVLLEGVL